MSVVWLVGLAGLEPVALCLETPLSGRVSQTCEAGESGAGHSTLAQMHAQLGGECGLEIADECQVGRRCFSLETMARLIEPEPLLGVAVPFHLAPVH